MVDIPFHLAKRFIRFVAVYWFHLRASHIIYCFHNFFTCNFNRFSDVVQIGYEINNNRSVITLYRLSPPPQAKENEDWVINGGKIHIKERYGKRRENQQITKEKNYFQ